MTNPYGEITVREKLGIIPVALKTAFIAATSWLYSPFRRASTASTVYKYVTIRGASTFLHNASFRQQQWLRAPTNDTYVKFAESKGFPPESFALASGGKGHWIGQSTAEKVLIYVHGGGYINPAAPGMLEYSLGLRSMLEQKGHNVAVCFLSYSLAVQERWPMPLRQVSNLLQNLIEKQGKRPENIIIAGDSAGGNLILALLSHTLHPHPSGIPSIKLSAPLAGVVLLSPWAGFDVSLPSFRTNASSDFLDACFLKNASDIVVGQEGPDHYNDPSEADAEWWRGLENVVKNVLIWGGGREVLIDQIVNLMKKMRSTYSGIEMILDPKACHDEMIFNVMSGLPKSKTTEEVESWISSRL